MAELYTHRLDGCAPTPLASYLKALGVLRLLSMPANRTNGEAADPTARGWWANEHFHLHTRLNRDTLLRFFLEDYAPSPIIAPWNGRAGFLEGDAGSDSNRTGAHLMKAIEESRSARFGPIRLVIAALRQEPMLVRYDKLRAAAKAAGEEEKKTAGTAKVEAGEKRKALTRQAEATKSILLPSLRSNAEAHHLDFIDACFVLTEDERAAPLLGSGGNDGSRDFGVNFAEALDALFDFDTGAPKTSGRGELETSIFGIVQQLEKTGAIGQFEPGQGGPNASTRYEGWNALNRWDVLLMLEGTLLFAGALTRRWGIGASGRAAFPFTFEPSSAGAGALSSDDPNAPRGEIWTPLWVKPGNLGEIGALFAEGRMTVGRATARTGLDAARAVAQLGISRGIAAFERYSLIQPDAKMPYQATPLGRFRTPDRPGNDLIADLDAGGWLTRVRRLSREKSAPARARVAVRRLEDALFEITRKERERDGLQAALMALGGVVSWLATSSEGREKIRRPPPRLSQRWVLGADDEKSPEFRVAAALASLGWTPNDRKNEPESAPDLSLEDEVESTGNDEAEPETKATSSDSNENQTVRLKAAPPMAAHFAPVNEKTVIRSSPLRLWAENKPVGVVWSAGSLVQNMIAVLERRVIEQALRGLDDKPFGGFSPARLADIAAFLEGSPAFDDARCAALLAGLVWARPTRLPQWRSDATVPFAYAALKPLFTPDHDLRLTPDAHSDARQFLSPSGTMPIPPGLAERLRRGGHGAVDAAVRDALARARASGIASPFSSRIASSTRFGAGVDPLRLAAALLIPINETALTQVMTRAYPKDSREEETDNAA